MTLLSRLVDAVVRVVCRNRLERDLDDELHAFLESAIDRKMASGLSPEAVRRAARLELGSAAAIKEAVHDMGWEAALSSFWQDVRYAGRMMRRARGWTAVVVGSLVFGIGGTSAVGLLANALFLLPPAGVLDSQRLVDIGSRQGRGGFGPIAFPDLATVRDRTSTLASVYGYSATPQQVSVGDPATESIPGMVVTSNYLTTLGVVPAAGRLFTANDDDTSGATAVAVLSHRFWTRRLNQAPTAIGQRLVLNGVPFTVIGVAPEGFHGTGLRVIDVWVPLGASAMAAFRGVSRETPTRWLFMGGRLKAGVSISEVAAEIRLVGIGAVPDFPDIARRPGLRAVASSSVPGGSAPAIAFLFVLGVIAVTILAIACANVGGLLLARSTARRQELAVRLAIGAGRSRLARQLVTETMVLFALGAFGGLLLARWATAELATYLSGPTFAIVIHPVVDARIAMFTIGVTLAATTVAGLAPGLLALKADLMPNLKNDGRGIRLHLRHGLMVMQVALSAILIVMAGFAIRALQKASDADIGFDPDGVELAAIDLSLTGRPAAAGLRLVPELLGRVRTMPGVLQASAAAVAPGGFESIHQEIALAPASATTSERFFSVDWNMVEPGYFSTLGASLVAGRDFAAVDDADATAVAIVSEGAASAFWPGRWPGLAIGERLTLPDNPRSSTGTSRTMLVVGVVPELTASSAIDGLSRPTV